MTLKAIASILLLLSFILAGPVSAGQEEDYKKLTPAAQRTLHKAQEALLAKDYPKASKVLQDYLAAHHSEKSYLIYYVLGTAHYYEKKLARAEAALRKAHELNPGHYSVCLNLALVSYERGRRAEAASLWEKAYGISEEPRPQLLYQAAVAWYETKEYGQVKRVLGRLLSESDKPKTSWLKLLIHTHLELKEYAEAERLLSRYLEDHPGQAEYWRLLAQVRLNRKKNVGAAEALEIAYAIEPPRPERWKTLANIYFYVNAPLKGARTLEKALGPSPTAKEYDRLFEAFKEAQRPSQALLYLDKALAQEPTADRHLNKGRYLYMLGRYPEAAKSLEAAIKLKPDLALAHLLAGICALEMDEPDLARRSFSRAAESKRYRSQARSGLAMLKRLEDAAGEADLSAQP